MNEQEAQATICRSADQSDIGTRLVLNRERVNLEPHQLVWCYDNDTHDQTFAPSLHELRKVIDYTRVFENRDDCQSYLSAQSPSNTVTFLVCSASAAKTLVPQVHRLDSIRFIYVYSSLHDQQWSNTFKKVKDVGNSSPLSVLSVDVQHHLLHERAGLLSGDFRSEGGDNSTGHFLSWWPSFIRVLCHLPYPREQCQRRMVNELRNYYKEKDVELRRIDDFECTYSAEKAIWWYTRDSFLFRILNTVLRRHDIQVMSIFGFFLKDLYLQLTREHSKLKSSEQPVLTVFRSQIMSHAELDTVYGGYQEILSRRRHKRDRDAEQFGFGTHSDDDLDDLDWCKQICFNSFCSTTLNREVAMIFLESSSSVPHGFSPVLLEIELDSRLGSRPFGNVSHLSNFKEENEILLMIGMRLLLQRVTFDENDGVYSVKLDLDDERDNPMISDLEYDTVCHSTATQRSMLSKCVSMIAAQFEMAFCSPDTIDAIFSELEELFPDESGWLQTVGKHQCLAVCNRKKWIDGKNPARALWHYSQAIAGWRRYADDLELNCTGALREINRDIVRLYENTEWGVNGGTTDKCAIDILNPLPDNTENELPMTSQALAVVELNLLKICEHLGVDLKNETVNHSREEQLQEVLERSNKD